MFSLLGYFKPAYLLELRPYTQSQTIKAMLIFFAILIVIGIGLKIYKETQKLEKFQTKLLERYFSLFTTMGIIGIVIVWLRFERVNLLAARFWLLVWAVIVLAWIYPILKYQFKIAPVAQKRAEEKKLFQKYLPKKK
jgi:hypothetical protein